VITGKIRCRWKDNIRIELRKTEWEAWTESIWLRLRTKGVLVNRMVNVPVA
jgi:hypothetical protein